MLGQYKISAVSPSLKEEVQFTVSEYVLPKFEVTLVPPAAVVRDAEMTEFKVCCWISFPLKCSVFPSLMMPFSRGKPLS